MYILSEVEVRKMTVASQVKTTLASLKSAQASLETFALSTQNQVSSRVQQLENEEPQYKGF
jgi:hypothetical protein